MARANMEAAERINAAREKSLRLMRMDSKLDAIVKNNRGEINENIEGAEIKLQSQPQISDAPRVNTKPIMSSGRMSQSASNMPREILESFKNNVIDESQLLNEVLGGGNDLSMIMDNTPKRQAETSMPKAITEAYGAPQQQVQPQSMNVVQSQVDYPMIRMIVEDVVKKYTASLQKKMLNESASQDGELGMLTIGKTFKFVSKNGDIYEATLKKIGNLNEQKKL